MMNGRWRKTAQKNEWQEERTSEIKRRYVEKMMATTTRDEKLRFDGTKLVDRLVDCDVNEENDKNKMHCNSKDVVHCLYGYENAIRR